MPLRSCRPQLWSASLWLTVWPTSKAAARASSTASPRCVLAQLGHAEVSETLSCAVTQADAQPAPATSGREAEPPLLSIDPRKLRADEELRRIFGSRVMRAEERDAAAGATFSALTCWVFCS